GVIRVRAFVGVFRPTLERLVWADHHVIALTHKAAANVLIHEDELLSRKKFRRPKRGAVLIDPVGRDIVPGALHHDRISFAVGEDILGHVNGREKFHAVAHRNAVFELRVILTNELAARSGGGSGGGLRGFGCRSATAGTALAENGRGEEKKNRDGMA